MCRDLQCSIDCSLVKDFYPLWGPRDGTGHEAHLIHPRFGDLEMARWMSQQDATATIAYPSKHPVVGVFPSR